jgi:hypothetical protein
MAPKWLINSTAGSTMASIPHPETMKQIILAYFLHHFSQTLLEFRNTYFSVQRVTVQLMPWD